MILTTELRRGNLVFDINGNVNYVYQIYSTGVELAENMQGGDDIDAREEEIFPIPITEEFLLKFGFEYRTDTGYDGWYSPPIAGESIRIFEVENGWYKFQSSTTVIKYVHRLQNFIFEMTDKELELKQ